MNGLRRLQAENIQSDIFSALEESVKHLIDIRERVLHGEITPMQAKRSSKRFLEIAIRNYTRLVNFQRSFESDIEIIDIAAIRVKYNYIIEFYL